MVVVKANQSYIFPLGGYHVCDKSCTPSKEEQFCNKTLIKGMDLGHGSQGLQRYIEKRCGPRPLIYTLLFDPQTYLKNVLLLTVFLLIGLLSPRFQNMRGNVYDMLACIVSTRTFRRTTKTELQAFVAGDIMKRQDWKQACTCRNKRV